MLDQAFNEARVRSPSQGTSEQSPDDDTKRADQKERRTQQLKVVNIVGKTDSGAISKPGAQGYS